MIIYNCHTEMEQFHTQQILKFSWVMSILKKIPTICIKVKSARYLLSTNIKVVSPAKNFNNIVAFVIHFIVCTISLVFAAHFVKIYSRKLLQFLGTKLFGGANRIKRKKYKTLLDPTTQLCFCVDSNR